MTGIPGMDHVILINIRIDITNDVIDFIDLIKDCPFCLNTNLLLDLFFFIILLELNTNGFFEIRIYTLE